MSDASISPERPNRNVECPECGESFAPRGLAAHRRMRHGIAPEAAAELAGTLTRIASVLERLDARLGADHVTEVQGTASTADAIDAIRSALPSRQRKDPPEKRLEQVLHDVLAEIARVKRETEDQIRHVAGRPLTDEQRKLEQTAFQALSTLRRKQADVIYRLQTETGTNGNGFDALASI